MATLFFLGNIFLLRISKGINTQFLNFRFVASIQRENFPEYLVSKWPQAGHTIILISPLTMTNLLPCDLHYSIKEANVRGHIKPGMSAAIHEVIFTLTL